MSSGPCCQNVTAKTHWPVKWEKKIISVDELYLSLCLKSLWSCILLFSGKFQWQGHIAIVIRCFSVPFSPFPHMSTFTAEAHIFHTATFYLVSASCNNVSPGNSITPNQRPPSFLLTMCNKLYKMMFWTKCNSSLVLMLTPRKGNSWSVAVNRRHLQSWVDFFSPCCDLTAFDLKLCVIFY